MTSYLPTRPIDKTSFVDEWDITGLLLQCCCCCAFLRLGPKTGAFCLMMWYLSRFGCCCFPWWFQFRFRWDVLVYWWKWILWRFWLEKDGLRVIWNSFLENIFMIVHDDFFGWLWSENNRKRKWNCVCLMWLVAAAICQSLTSVQ